MRPGRRDKPRAAENLIVFEKEEVNGVEGIELIELPPVVSPRQAAPLQFLDIDPVAEPILLVERVLVKVAIGTRDDVHTIHLAPQECTRKAIIFHLFPRQLIPQTGD